MVVSDQEDPSSLRPSTDERDARTCPLCAQPSRTLETFAFAHKPHLPHRVRLACCAACDFVFIGDLSASSYRRYYASVRNDEGHVLASDAPDSHVALQSNNLRDALGSTFRGRLLDFGCGQGHLLRALTHRFPDASLFGHDVADHLDSRTQARFLATIDDPDVRFDAIVLSHVVEHLVDFECIGRLARSLAPDGLMYVEVPDPLSYTACPRREFLYYVDRLHVNHFGRRAMRRLLGRFGLVIRRSGHLRFAYRDGRYPAMYCVAGRAGDRAIVEEDVVDDPPLDRVFADYLEDEQRRAGVLRAQLQAAGGSAGVLVHGAGDNFHRSRRAGGPLEGVELLAVMDRRAAQMLSCDGLRVETPDVALARHPEAPVVVTVSQQAEAIVASLKAAWPDRRVFLA